MNTVNSYLTRRYCYFRSVIITSSSVIWNVSSEYSIYFGISFMKKLIISWTVLSKLHSTTIGSKSKYDSLEHGLITIYNIVSGDRSGI